MKKYRNWLLLAVVMAIVIAACGGGDDDGATTTAGETATTAGPTTTAGEGEATTTAAAAAGDTGYENLDAALAGEYEGTTVDVWAQWLPESSEAANFTYTLEPFQEATGITVNFQPTPDYETALQVAVDGGNAPDIAQIAQPGKMIQYGEAGSLVDIGSWINTEKLQADMVPAFYELGLFNDSVHGIYYKADVKSIVWYPVAGFEEQGYAVPTTWDELTALSDQIIADGNGNPWCISIESQEADGWVATDWMEDILLRTAPIETYNAWISHEIPFNDPEVLEAAELMKQIWFTPDYAYGGSTYINATWIGETQDPMFSEEGPQCWMQKQAAWIGGFWGANRDALADDPALPQTEWPIKPETDVDFFYFPPIEDEFGKPVLGAADMFVQFEDRPEVRALLEWLATPEAAAGWIERGGFLSTLNTVPPDSYVYPNTELAVLVQEATTLGFDASDLMPAEVGAGTFWSGMIDWVAANGENTEEVFQGIEDSWPAG
ncbi:MAG: extracellular solute-binding protein [Acidimicrobiia bacterium]